MIQFTQAPAEAHRLGARALMDARADCCDLEIQLKGKLNHTWSSARGNDSTERANRYVVHRVRIVDPVESIEKLNSDFAPELFVDRNKLNQRKVHVLLSRSSQKIPLRVAERVRRIERWVVNNSDARTIKPWTGRNEGSLSKVVVQAT